MISYISCDVIKSSLTNNERVPNHVILCRAVTTFLLLLVFPWSGRGGVEGGDVIEWTVEEEAQAHTFIGNIRTELLQRPAVMDADLLGYANFRFLPKPNQDLSVFVIDAESGIVRTSPVRIDRETYCGTRQSACTVDLSIGVVRSQQLEAVVNVRITITDINDNAPTFSTSPYEVRISETARPGFTVPLPLATDADTGVNGVADYQLQTSHNEFQLKVTRDSQTGQVTPHLVLMSTLQFDTVPYALTLEAVDGGEGTTRGHGSRKGQGGSGRLTGSTVIHVSVEDANDHAPIFDDPVVSVHIREDHPTGGTLVYRLSATDADRGANADLSYSLTPASALAHGQTFVVNRSTGHITLKRALDYESETVYTLEAMAVDAGAEPQTGTQTVVVHVDDVNDNAPLLTVNILRRGGTTGGYDEDEAEVSENAPAGSFLAHLSVLDADTGKNGDVICRMTSPGVGGEFALTSMAPGQYKLTTTRELDHEGGRNAYQVGVECTDEGHPPLSTRAIVPVVVADVNDNAPVFVTSLYVVSIAENNEPDASIVQVRALDADSGVNAELTYSFVDDDEEDKVKDFVYFDTRTGLIRAASVLDYESPNKTIRFTIKAVDGGQPTSGKTGGGSNSMDVVRLTATASVIINVVDVNDVEPKFEVDSYEFRVRENSQPGTVIGHVSASDLDTPPFNQFVYSVVDTYENNAFDLFAIDPRSGKIIAKVAFDREGLRDRYKFTVVAIDQDRPVLRGEVSVLVRIDDENDNAPIISHPSRDNNTFYVSSRAPVGYVFLEVIASDIDEGVNSQLTYVLASGAGGSGGGTEGLFTINSTTGRVSVKSDLSAILHQRHRIRLTVYDMGAQSRDTTTTTATNTQQQENNDVMTSSRLSASRSNSTKSDVNFDDADLDGRPPTLTIQTHEDGRGKASTSSAAGPGVPYVNKDSRGTGERGGVRPGDGTNARRHYNILGGQDHNSAGPPAKSASIDAIVIVDASIAFHVDVPGKGKGTASGTSNRIGVFIVDNLSTVVIGAGCLAAALVIIILCVLLSVRLCNGRRRYPPAEQVYSCRAAEEEKVREVGGSLHSSEDLRLSSTAAAAVHSPPPYAPAVTAVSHCDVVTSHVTYSNPLTGSSKPSNFYSGEPKCQVAANNNGVGDSCRRLNSGIYQTSSSDIAPSLHKLSALEMRLLTELSSSDTERRHDSNNCRYDNGGGAGRVGCYGDCTCELSGSATDMSADSGVACDLDPNVPDARIDGGETNQWFSSPMSPSSSSSKNAIVTRSYDPYYGTRNPPQLQLTYQPPTSIYRTSPHPSARRDVIPSPTGPAGPAGAPGHDMTSSHSYTTFKSGSMTGPRSRQQQQQHQLQQQPLRHRLQPSPVPSLQSTLVVGSDSYNCSDFFFGAGNNPVTTGGTKFMTIGGVDRECAPSDVVFTRPNVEGKCFGVPERCEVTANTGTIPAGLGATIQHKAHRFPAHSLALKDKLRQQAGEVKGRQAVGANDDLSITSSGSDNYEM